MSRSAYRCVSFGRTTRHSEVAQSGVRWTGNAQTSDVRGPEPRPAVELPILRNNALYKADCRGLDGRTGATFRGPTIRPERVGCFPQGRIWGEFAGDRVKSG